LHINSEVLVEETVTEHITQGKAAHASSMWATREVLGRHEGEGAHSVINLSGWGKKGLHSSPNLSSVQQVFSHQVSNAVLGLKKLKNGLKKSNYAVLAASSEE
jgi:hypothetical protein